jgi:hypothetical protein
MSQATEHADLLSSYRPLLVYDPQGDFRALAVDSVFEVSGNRLVHKDGCVLADTAGSVGRKLTLGRLSALFIDLSRTGALRKEAIAAREWQGQVR